MSDIGLAGQDRGTGDDRFLVQVLQTLATDALVQAEAITARAARGEPATGPQLERFVLAAETLDRAATAFLADADPDRPGPQALRTAAVLRRVSAAIDVTRRTIDLLVSARLAEGRDGPDAVHPLVA